LHYTAMPLRDDSLCEGWYKVGSIPTIATNDLRLCVCLLMKISRNLILKTKDMNTENIKSENSKLSILDVRQRAMLWWNNLRLTERVVEMNRFGIEPYRSSDSLTGREIQVIYESLHVA